MQEDVQGSVPVDSRATAPGSGAGSMNGTAIAERGITAAAEPQSFSGIQAQAARDLEVSAPATLSACMNLTSPNLVETYKAGSRTSSAGCVVYERNLLETKVATTSPCMAGSCRSA